MHLVFPWILSQKVADFAFNKHQKVPKPLMSLSSHTEGAHWEFAAHVFLQFLIFFLHLTPDASLHP